MSKLYNAAFKTGFILTVVFFILMNVVSLFVSRHEYLKRQTDGPTFAPVGGGYNWGFPFSWSGFYKLNYLEDGVVETVLNFVVIVSCSFIVGFLVRFLRQNLLK